MKTQMGVKPGTGECANYNANGGPSVELCPDHLKAPETAYLKHSFLQSLWLLIYFYARFIIMRHGALLRC